LYPITHAFVKQNLPDFSKYRTKMENLRPLCSHLAGSIRWQSQHQSCVFCPGKYAAPQKSVDFFKYLFKLGEPEHFKEVIEP
jgi:hypothetical protein